MSVAILPGASWVTWSWSPCSGCRGARGWQHFPPTAREALPGVEEAESGTDAVREIQKWFLLGSGEVQTHIDSQLYLVYKTRNRHFVAAP